MASLPDPSLPVEDYLARYDAALTAGHPPPEPETVSQLYAVRDHYPDRAWRHWPSPEDCRAKGIDYPPHRRTRPVPGTLRDRLAADIARDPHYWGPLLVHALASQT